MYEIRKVQIFLDGRQEFADDVFHTKNTELSGEPWDDIFEGVCSDSEFEFTKIGSEEFYDAWDVAHVVMYGE